MLRWSIEKIILELRYTWKISRNASDRKINMIVRVGDDQFHGLGESAPNVRYGESPEELTKQFESFLALNPAEINNRTQLENYLGKIQLSNSLRFALESAFVHYLSSRDHTTVFEILDTDPPRSIRTSYSIPIMEVGTMKDFYEQNQLSRFQSIKLKIDRESGTEAIGYLESFCSKPLIIDANEAYHDVEECIYFLERVKKKNIEFVEQPLPSGMTEESIYLKKYSPFRLFADESISNEADFSLLKGMFHGVNIKLMKAGGYFNAVRLLQEAKEQNMQTMIGCMVETTLGISSAMNLCSLADYVDLDSFLLVKNEPYHFVEEKNGELLFKIS